MQFLKTVINRRAVPPEVKNIFEKHGFFYILIVISSWYHTGDETADWFIVLTAYAILSSLFPFVCWIVVGGYEYFLLSIVGILRIYSNLSDLYYVDRYDREILFIKIVLTLYALLIMIIKLERVSEMINKLYEKFEEKICNKLERIGEIKNKLLKKLEEEISKIKKRRGK